MDARLPLPDIEVTAKVAQYLEKNHSNLTAACLPDPDSPTFLSDKNCSKFPNLTKNCSEFTNITNGSDPEIVDSSGHSTGSSSSGSSKDRGSQNGIQVAFPTRVGLKPVGIPAQDPLMFVATRPSALKQSAKAQIETAQEVKKKFVQERMIPAQEDDITWQTNLDSWRARRRNKAALVLAQSEANVHSGADINLKSASVPAFTDSINSHVQNGLSSGTAVHFT